MRVIVVIGARPNFVKVAPVIPRLSAAGHDVDIVFTGSRRAHRDSDPAGTLSFHGVEVPTPKWFLDVGEETDARETGRALVSLEGLFAEQLPDAVLAIGDVNPTLATALAASKLGIPVIHLEAGLRCGIMSCPGEVNRVLLSRMASLHLVPTEEAVLNLLKEGVSEKRVHFVGSMMAESVLRHLDNIKASDAVARYGEASGEYLLLSVHHYENISDPARMRALVEATEVVGRPVLFPDGQDVCEALESFGVSKPVTWTCLEPMAYLDMLALERGAAAVITDSGGVQEEACMVGTPCVTWRDHTEHGATLDVAANRLAGGSAQAIVQAVHEAMGSKRGWVTPKRWDRAVSDRIVRAIGRGVQPL